MDLQKLRPQNKMVNVNDRLGNDFLKNQQGTTKMVYDTLEITGQNKYNFFQDSNTRSFPMTNVKNDSLPVAESLAVQRISLSILTIVPLELAVGEDSILMANATEITGLNKIGIGRNYQGLIKCPTPPQEGREGGQDEELGLFCDCKEFPWLSPILLGELSIKIANDIVMKPIKVSNFLPQFNKNASNDLASVFEFNTDLIIPPQLNFEVELRAPNHMTINNLIPCAKQYIQLTIEGVGAQFNGKVNF